ncbi:response regulator transcription factor [Pseudenhygromyxa sp. WMMC2535]|uniref:response regulator transcription factor n=1 Tax=Pseudenhygromyxa sp. WMMC2535 TaxID=2712867 RepID=UPI001551769C|nr:response regulator transcription factor [Pseudenhygromyxa sp. WMMC2535]NVB38662.1 response regulator transcription factor [Pseudenhygromyxa sp. WMMC2535]
MPEDADAPIQVLMVEDDERLAQLTERYLAKHNLVITRVADGERAIAAASEHRYDVVLLDLMLPGCDGLTVCEALREHDDVPIIMISARGSDDERVAGIERGADDYLAKPFNPRELLARVNAIVRRERGQLGPTQRILEVGELVLEPKQMRAHLAGAALDLTAYEFRLLYALAEHPGRPLSRERLLDRVHRGKAEEAFERSIDVHVSRLRRKLGAAWMLRTVRGQGYMLLDDASQARRG